MNPMRQYKRSWLLLLVFVASVLPLQTVFACSEMGEQIRAACCCEASDSAPCGEENSCDSGLLQASQACCEVSYHAALDDGAVSTIAAQPGKCTAALLAMPPADPAVLPAASGNLIRSAALAFDGRPPSPIYLATRRLRI